MLEIVEETEDFLVVNKPGDLVCHPTKGDAFSSLIGRLRLYLEGSGAEPRFVNRLDRETSGLVVISKNRPYHKQLCRQLAGARKVYRAVVEGEPPEPEGVVDQPLGSDEASPVMVKQTVRADGKPSRTRWRLLRKGLGMSLLEVVAETGRTHQIRVHLGWLGCPIVGDKLYGHDETLYLEFTERGWTERHEATLGARRQLLSALELHLADHCWRIPPPDDFPL